MLLTCHNSLTPDGKEKIKKRKKQKKRQKKKKTPTFKPVFFFK